MRLAHEAAVAEETMTESFKATSTDPGRRHWRHESRRRPGRMPRARSCPRAGADGRDGTAEAASGSGDGAIDSFSSAGRAGGIQSIGICAPGPLDPKTGIVLNPPNLPCWRNFPLAEKIAEQIPLTRQSRQRRERRRAGRNSVGSRARLSLRFLCHDRNRNRNRNRAGRPYLSRQDRFGGRGRTCEHRLPRAGLRLRQARMHRDSGCGSGDRGASAGESLQATHAALRDS